MRSAWSVFTLAGRAAVWRKTPDSRPVGLPSLFFWVIGLAALRVALQFAAAGPGAGFNPYGLNAVVAWLALEVAIAALIVPTAARSTALSAMFALLIVAELAAEVLRLTASRLPPAVFPGAPWINRTIPIATFAAVSVWWIGAMAAALCSFTPQLRLRALGRVLLLWVALLAVTALVPHAPVFVGRDFDIRMANWWEMLHTRFLASVENAGAAQGQTARVDEAQRSLLQAEVGQLIPPAKGVTNVYAIGVAGWADQDVFVKELDGGLAAIGEVLPIKGHTLRLVNHRDTLASLPLATQHNFAAAVHAISEVMNKNDDVLLLLMTSHGETTGFGLRLPNAALGELKPQEVAGALDKEGIKNRVVIVSACYAGIFVPPLANDDTIVLTAADAKNTSFGCAPERDWTYFGDAFFRQSVRSGRDFQRAFDNARALIHGWELMDRATPSNPQGHFGPALVAKLAPLFAAPSGAQR
jgi:Peptidase C13 family